MKKPITPDKWNKLSKKEQHKRIREFNEHAEEYDKKGVPIGLYDLRRLAIKYQVPIPTHWDEKGNSIFKGFKLKK